jgi:hypothetical protein
MYPNLLNNATVRWEPEILTGTSCQLNNKLLCYEEKHKHNNYQNNRKAVEKTLLHKPAPLNHNHLWIKEAGSGLSHS